jgi:hypothetical protein
MSYSNDLYSIIVYHLHTTVTTQNWQDTHMPGGKDVVTHELAMWPMDGGGETYHWINARYHIPLAKSPLPTVLVALLFCSGTYRGERMMGEECGVAPRGHADVYAV